MAYKLKTTGIAANCTMCIAVDPDTNTIKDFTSAAVTADVTVGANVTISEQAWDGITRKYFRLGAGATAADFVAFGTNKPQWDFNSGESRTWVAICEVAGAQARVMGGGSSSYMASQNTSSGGSTFPTTLLGGTASGPGAALSSGNKRIFGFSLVHNTSSTYYYAADTDAAMTTGSATTLAPSGTTFDFALTHVGRRNDSTTKQQDKWHAILIFNTALTQAQWDSLRDDWFSTLLEVEASGTNGTISVTDSGDIVSITGSATSAGSINVTDAGDTVSVVGVVPGAIAVTDAPDTVSVTGTATSQGSVSVTDAGDTVSITGTAGSGGNIRLQPFLVLDRGGPAASRSNLRWRVFHPNHGAIAASGTGLSTNTSGQLTIDINASPFSVGDWVELQVTEYDAGVVAADRLVLAFTGFVQAIAQT